MSKDEEYKNKGMWTKPAPWMIILFSYLLFCVWFGYYLWIIHIPKELGLATTLTFALIGVVIVVKIVFVASKNNW